MRTINSIFKVSFFLFILTVGVHTAYSQTAALLPVAPQQFFDKNGNPVSSGSVGYYIPGTSTPKMVWQDDSQTTPWANPITLNAGGWPPNNKGIYGNGIYRQIVKDKFNNIISDQPTSATGTGGGAGTSVGDGNSVGTILTWSGMIAPNQYQFAYGQALSRTTYPELYQAITLQTPVTCVGGNTTLTGISDTSNIPVGAALEGNCIVAGSTVISKTINTVTLSIAANISTTANIRFFPYGNGNGTTTFNAPDLRGKVIPGRTNMGGVTASNLTNTYYGSSPDAVGANGGTQSSTLAQSNLPNVNFNVSIPSGQGAHTHSYTLTSGANQTLQPGGANIATVSNSASNTGSSTLPAMTGTAPSGGSGTAFSLVQPSMTLNYIIKVTPDTSISGLFGVASIGGMQGIIACGTGLTCAGNTISAGSISTNITVNSTLVNSGTDGYYLYSQGGILKNSPPIYKSIIDCGADPSGVTDSTSAINTCIQTYNYVSVPTGNYKISSPGIQIGNYQGIIGIGPLASVFIYNDTTGYAINPSGTGVTISGLSIDRTSAVPVSGGGIGHTNSLNDSNFYDLLVQNQYNGYNFPPCYYCVINNIIANSNYNDGIRFTTTNTAPVSQYFASNMSASANNGWGFKIDTSGTTQPVTFLTWDKVNTYINNLGALSAVTTSNAPINDLRITNVNFSTDNNTLVALQTYGIHNSIIGGLVEQAGSTASGRGGLIAPSNVGSGISLKNNTQIVLSGLMIRTNSQHGIVSDGTDTNVIIANSMISANGTASNNTYDGINIASGTITPIIDSVNSGWGANVQRYGINSSDVDTLVTNSLFNGVTGGCNFPAGAFGATNVGTKCAVAGLQSNVQFIGATSGSTTVVPLSVASGLLTLPSATDTLVGKATTDIFTNKTFDTAGTGNSFSINGLAVTSNTGTGSVVRATSPTITTPTGIVKADVGLGNVDNTSDATKNAAAVTLTNKTITAASLNGAGHVVSGGSLSIDAGAGFAINNGGFTFSGALSPQMNFQPSSGATQAGQINQTGDIFSLARFGGPNYLSIDLTTGVISGVSTVAATSPTTGTIKSAGGIGASGAIWAGTYINITPTVVTSLPTCNAALDGARAYVTNNNTAPAWQGAVTAGGTNRTPVYCDGNASAWKQG